MSMNPRCFVCDELLPKHCRCDANPNPIYRPSFIEEYERERANWDVRVKELPNGRWQAVA